ncbi:MAG TPA: ATP-binding cassette domain-containing protein [Anaerolineales bacterium]|jgi:ABC-2 type transport system ATP-binding protein|nr:ATP-binding cassette domain-containing protein [Anaerolineales bacterium]
MNIIETNNLTRRFGKLTAVDAVDLTLEEGEIFGLLGPNGAGKTTLLKMFTTLLPPSSGSAKVAGLDVVRNSGDVRKVIGYVPQLLSADGSLTGYENLLVFAKLFDLPRAQREARIHALLHMMGLEEAAHQMVKTYSGGMIRRLEIAQSVLHEPRVLFLDEPTVGLDPIARKSVWEHIQRLRSQFSTTILLTTHYMEEADDLCERVAIMHHGKIAAIGQPAELKASVNGGSATLDEVFAHFAGGEIEASGSYIDVSRTRHDARRVG